MILKLLIIFSAFSIVSCKGNLNKSNNFVEEGCYEVKNGYVYMNFYNNTNEDMQIPEIMSVIDKDFYLLDGYFKIENDTLLIIMPNESHIGISHRSVGMKVEVINTNIHLKKGKKIQQLFKLKENFKYIILDDHLLKKCD